MMDHKAYLASRDPDFRKAITRKRNAPGLFRITVHWGCIAVLGWMIHIGVPLWPVLLLPQGILLISLFMLEHECTHQTPFASRWLNEAAGHLAGFVILLPFRWFRYFHLAHHRWTNIPGKDPELSEPLPRSRSGWALYLSGVQTWKSLAGVLLRLVADREHPNYLPDKARSGAVVEARIMVLGYVVALALVPTLVWSWLIPLVLGQPFLRLYLLAEHGDCPKVSNMFANTRTTFTTGLLRWFAWNMPYHTEHHVWPAVPFHELPRLHQDLRAHLQVTAPGYAAFNRTYLGRRLRRGGDQGRGNM